MSNIRIGIIGGGGSGATACKACLEENFDVVVYERTDYTAGIWRYHEDEVEGAASVTKATFLNSCKETTCFSDCPPPPHFPNLMHHSQMVKYLDIYGENFNYEKYVRLRHEVIKVEPNTDYDSTGKWIITVKDLQSGKTIEDVVDGVMVCTGHHVHPSMPSFKNQDKFKGEILHSQSYKKPDRFADKKVVVVGLGNSGGDTSDQLSHTAQKVYLSIRRGKWLLPKTRRGKTVDSMVLSRLINLFMTYLPKTPSSLLFEFIFNAKFIHPDAHAKPDHRFISSDPLVSDTLYNRIESAMIEVKPNIDRFTENGVIFEGETFETECDVVVMATGYKICFPFLSQSLIPVNKNEVQLYKNMFPPNLKHPKTLAFISLVQPIGSILAVGELQSRWFAQLMSDRVRLPNTQTMIKDIEKNKRKMKNQFYESERHTIQVEWINYMDELALEIGAKPNLFKYFITDPKLWRALIFGLNAPYVYRLEGPHSWSGARDAILTVNERMAAAKDKNT